jgi:hypothetical protein
MADPGPSRQRWAFGRSPPEAAGVLEPCVKIAEPPAGQIGAFPEPVT